MTGRFTGTTDEILQWAAWKWGFDEDILRAQAVVESGWHMSMIGDGGASFGLMQLKWTSNPGTYPLSSLSTAFNADYSAALLRYYYDGSAAWLNDRPRRGSYVAGDLAGSLGAYFSGSWHTPEADGVRAPRSRRRSSPSVDATRVLISSPPKRASRVAAADVRRVLSPPAWRR